jgi:hypothetical protein
VPIPKWQILLLVITFFVGVWASMLLILTHLSKTHTWLLPVFAVGLGAPRWCQVSQKLCIDENVLNSSTIDAMGYILLGIIHTMGWKGWSLSWHIFMALVGRPGCNPRGWPRHDPPSSASDFFLLPCNIFLLSRRLSHGCTSVLPSLSLRLLVLFV